MPSKQYYDTEDHFRAKKSRRSQSIGFRTLTSTFINDSKQIASRSRSKSNIRAYKFPDSNKQKLRASLFLRRRNYTDKSKHLSKTFFRSGSPSSKALQSYSPAPFLAYLSHLHSSPRARSGPVENPEASTVQQLPPQRPGSPSDLPLQNTDLRFCLVAYNEHAQLATVLKGNSFFGLYKDTVYSVSTLISNFVDAWKSLKKLDNLSFCVDEIRKMISEKNALRKLLERLADASSSDNSAGFVAKEIGEMLGVEAGSEIEGNGKAAPGKEAWGKLIKKTQLARIDNHLTSTKEDSRNRGEIDKKNNLRVLKTVSVEIEQKKSIKKTRILPLVNTIIEGLSKLKPTKNRNLRSIKAHIEDLIELTMLIEKVVLLQRKDYLAILKKEFGTNRNNQINQKIAIIQDFNNTVWKEPAMAKVYKNLISRVKKIELFKPRVQTNLYESISNFEMKHGNLQYIGNRFKMNSKITNSILLE